MATKKEMELAQQKRAAERKARSALDGVLLRNARKSYEELEELTGVPAAQCAERLSFLLRSRDHLTERQEERLLIIEMSDLIDETRARLEHVSEQYYSDTANVALRGYEAIGKRMDSRAEITEQEMAEITRVQAEVYIETLNLLVSKTMDYIAEVYPDMDTALEDAITAGFRKYLPEAYEEIRSRARD